MLHVRNAQTKSDNMEISQQTKQETEDLTFEMDGRTSSHIDRLTCWFSQQDRGTHERLEAGSTQFAHRPHRSELRVAVSL